MRTIEHCHKMYDEQLEFVCEIIVTRYNGHVNACDNVTDMPKLRSGQELAGFMKTSCKSYSDPRQTASAKVSAPHKRCIGTLQREHSVKGKIRSTIEI
jgi:hypothetical protein